MEIYVDGARKTLHWRDRQVPCAIGKAGITKNKKEGDHASPVGRFPLRRLLYRKDRLGEPETLLPRQEIRPEDGWCDDPAHPDYNRPVHLPFTASHEELWRQDHVYDLVVVLGHNDDPPVPDAGSAIFFHLARPDYEGTEGCVAVSLAHMREILTACEGDDWLEIGTGKPAAAEDQIAPQPGK